MPQTFPRYEGYYAEEEEFSTRVENVGYGESYNYYVYSMYVSVSLGEQGFETEQDVENYYDGWLRRLGWEEERPDLCNPYMREFQPVESYRAYTNPDNFATACLVTWFEFGDGEYLGVMIKTINPSAEVSWDLD